MFRGMQAGRRWASSGPRASADPFDHFVARPGEVRLGETIQRAGCDDPRSAATHILVGVPEDIGIRANGGRGGASATPAAVVSALLQFQSNHFFGGAQLGWGGMVPVADLQALSAGLEFPNDADRLRDLTAQVDARVIEHLRPLFKAGKVPIIIGGGHNNAYGTLTACSTEHGGPVNAINFDPHPDCRALEGRHSGNGFSYAYNEGRLGKYAVLGLYETASNAASLEMLSTNPGWTFQTYDSWAIRGDTTLTAATDKLLAHVGGGSHDGSHVFGLEIDTDGIAFCPSSAQTATGWDWSDVRRLAYKAGGFRGCAYMHVCEASVAGAAPHDRSSVAKAVAHIIVDFVRGHQSNRSRL